MSILTFKNVSKSMAKPAWSSRHINPEVAEGEFVVILGFFGHWQDHV